MTERPAVFNHGDGVYLRGIFADHVGAVLPSVVVEDAVKCVALFQPAGTTMLLRTGRRGGPNARTMYPDGWDGGHVDVPWVGCGVLRVHRPGQPWSVWRWLDRDGWRAGCYVNLERPWLRSPLGFDTTDWILDLVIAPDGTVAWKDDDELRWSVDVGATTPGHEAEIRAAGVRAVAAAQGGEWPWNVEWNQWLPDPQWTAPLVDGRRRQRALAILPTAELGRL